MTTLLRVLVAMLAMPIAGVATAVAYAYGGPWAAMAACVSALVGAACCAAIPIVRGPR